MASYTKAEVDAKIEELQNSLTQKIDNMIIMSTESEKPDAEETALWLKIRENE